MASLFQSSGPTYVSARYTTAAGQSISNGSTAIVNFDTKDYDTNNAVTTGASWKFTAPTPGKYLVRAYIQYSGSSSYTAAGFMSFDLYKNGSSLARLGAFTVGSTNTQSIGIGGSEAAALVAGDFIDVRTTHSEGTARSLNASALVVHISIDLVGP